MYLTGADGAPGWDGSSSRALVSRGDDADAELRSIAERNEELNRRRLEAARRPSGGGGLKIVNRAAFDRFHAEAEKSARARAEAEEAEERERARREGASYKPRAQREAEAAAHRARFRDADGPGGGGPDGDNAKCREQAPNPALDYYAALGIEKCASAAEVRKSYKRAALLLHPDKQPKGATAEQLASVAAQLAAVLDAYDVLSDEAKRASYDRLREAARTGGGGGARGGGSGFVSSLGRPLTAEEHTALAKGLAELAAARRAAVGRHIKHGPLHLDLPLSILELHAGCLKTLTISRQSLDTSGAVFEATKNLHVCVRRGSAPGTEMLFPGQGHESAALLPGDVVVTLREQNGSDYKRVGAKDLARAGPATVRGDVYYCDVFTTPNGRRQVLCGPVLLPCLAAGGMGGSVRVHMPGEGLLDPIDPWDQPPGDLTATFYYPAVAPAERIVRVSIQPQAVLLAGSAVATGPGAVAGAIVGAAQAHRRAAAELYAGEAGDAGAGTRVCAGGVCLRLRSGAGGAPAGSDNRMPAPSPAAAAAMCAAASRLPGLRWRTVAAAVPPYGSLDSEQQLLLTDDEWLALYDASVIIIDDVDHLKQQSDPCDDSSRPVRGAGPGPAAASEAALSSVLASLEASGPELLHAITLRWLHGASLIGIGMGVALLGHHAPGGEVGAEAQAAAEALWPCARAALVPLLLRPGGAPSDAAYEQCHRAAAAAAATSAAQGSLSITAAGVPDGGLVVVDPVGGAELVVVPPRDSLIATAGARNARWGSDVAQRARVLFERSGGDGNAEDNDSDGFAVTCSAAWAAALVAAADGAA